MLFNKGSAEPYVSKKHVIVLAKVHQGFHDDKKVEEH